MGSFLFLHFFIDFLHAQVLVNRLGFSDALCLQHQTVAAEAVVESTWTSVGCIDGMGTNGLPQ